MFNFTMYNTLGYKYISKKFKNVFRNYITVYFEMLASVNNINTNSK